MGRVSQPRPWTVGLLAVSLAVATAACFPDYDRFRNVAPADVGGNNGTNNGTTPTNNGTNNGTPTNNGTADVGVPDADADMVDADADMVDADADMVDADADMVDADVADDVTDEEVVEVSGIGAACNSDADCEGGLVCLTEFDSGFCSEPCAADADCPSSAVCAADVGLPFCLLTCTVNCADVRNYDCLEWRGGDRVCVSDRDRDGALNDVDTCPEAADPAQRDVDRDGAGDACDVDPRCPLDNPTASFETLAVDRAAPPRPLRQGALLYVPPLMQTWYIGGLDAEGNPTDEILAWDMVADTWGPAPVPPLPFAATGLAAVWDGVRGEVILTPGVNAAGSTRLLLLPIDRSYAADHGVWRLGQPLGDTLHRPAMELLHPDHVTISGYTAPTVEGGAMLVTWIFDRGDGSLTRADQTFTPTADGEIGDLVATAHQDRRVYLFNASQRDFFYVIDPAARTFARAVHPDLGVPRLNPTLFLDTAAPVPMVGGATQAPYTYFARLDTGDIQRVKVPAGQTLSSQYSLPLPDQQAVDNLVFQGLFNEEAVSVLALSTTIDTPMTSVREYFVLCQNDLSTGQQSDDTDRDTISSLRDNCDARNQLQEDLDGDGLGFSSSDPDNPACDLDVDGDGVPNGDDPFPMDMDNDGTPDLDDGDADGDRIPDAEDPSLKDSDNDGVLNWLDTDDDGDGVPDTAELAEGSSATDVFSVPGGERVVFILVTGEERHVVITPITALGFGAEFTPLDLPGVAPVGPRLQPGAERLLFTDVTDPTAPALVVQDLTPTEEDTLPDPVRLTPEGFVAGQADFVPAGDALEVALLRSVTDAEAMTTSWLIDYLQASLDALPLAMVTNLVTSDMPIEAIDAANATPLLAFSQGIEGCAICQELYSLTTTVGDYAPLSYAHVGLGQSMPALAPEGNAVAFLVEEGEGRAAWVAWQGGPGPVAVTPEGWDVQSVAFAQNAWRLLVTASPAGTDEPPALYLIDLNLDMVWPLTPEGVHVEDVSFAP